MKTIKLSPLVVSAYKETRTDISYALSELLGAVSYANCTKIMENPMIQNRVIEYEISDDVYEELQDKFDSLENYDVVAEMLLWANYIMGSRI